MSQKGIITCERFKERMEIALIGGIEPFVTKPGGTRSYVLNLIKNLSERRVKGTLFGVSYGPSNNNLPEGFIFLPIAKGKNVSSMKYLFYLTLKTPFHKILRSTIVHAQRPDILFPFAFFKRKNPKVCTMHGMDSMAIRSRKGKSTGMMYGFLERYSLKRADKVIFVDSRSEKWYVDRYPWLNGKTTMIHVGVDTDEFKPLDRGQLKRTYSFGQEEKIILFVGRLEKEKRIDLIIQGCADLQGYIKARLVIVGDGPERKRLEHLATSKNVTFLGTIPHNRIPEVMNCADVLVLCSEYEGMPTVVLEALACGVPVVSTNVGDVGTVVFNKRTGYITNGSSEDLRDKLIKALENGESMRDNCIKMAETHSWQVVMERTFEVYNEVSKDD